MGTAVAISIRLGQTNLGPQAQQTGLLQPGRRNNWVLESVGLGAFITSLTLNNYLNDYYLSYYSVSLSLPNVNEKLNPRGSIGGV